MFYFGLVSFDLLPNRVMGLIFV
ncbi:uncharacterized protein METZ01_LOCUS42007 [marine metagenome]|uniref:Uncharacterized protein n=1 Tax=marine metagenome TaxID=408172 RepID=A0A381RJ81_9ZZZZ